MALLQHLKKHKKIVAIYSLLFGIVIIIILLGGRSLTGRLWANDSMKLKLIHFNEVVCYENQENTHEIYIELPTKYGKWSYKITRSNEHTGRSQNFDWLGIRDYADIKNTDRRWVVYNMLIFPEESIAKEDCRIDFDGHFIHSAFMSAQIERVTSQPPTFTKKRILPHVQLRKFLPDKPSIFGLLLKIIATPITLSMDIVLIPTCYGCMFVTLLTGFGT